MKARDIMTEAVLTVSPDTKVSEVAQLLADNHISGAPVVDGDEVVGIISEGDLLRRSEIGTERRHGSWWLRLFADDTAVDFIRAHGLRVRDVMTPKVISVTEDTALSEIADLFESKRIKRVPVIRSGKLVGIVSRANLVRALASAGAKAMPDVQPSDSEIREKLTESLESQPWWDKYRASINVVDGVVHFWGLAGPSVDQRAARVAAEEIPGVKGVEDHRFDINISRYA